MLKGCGEHITASPSFHVILSPSLHVILSEPKP